MKPDVTIYTTQICGFCARAKMLLDNKNLEYNEISVDNNRELIEEMAMKAQKSSVPQIWINGIHIGGCDDLYELEYDGKLNDIINKQQ